MTWFDLTGDSRLGRCATENCGGQPVFRLEAGGVSSNYCSGCHAMIVEIGTMGKLNRLTDKIVENILETPDDQIIDEIRIETLEELVVDLSAALTDEGPDWSFEGVADLRRRVVQALPDDDRIEWLRIMRQ